VTSSAILGCVEQTFQRARSAERKDQRRDDLLTAAKRLVLEEGARSVSLAGIAEGAGLARSAPLRYFESRDALLLELATHGWQEWVPALEAALARSQRGDIRRIAETVAGSLAERPVFCDLIIHVPADLERDVSMETVRAFKLEALAGTERIGTAVAGACPPLTAVDGFDLVASTLAVAGYSWQVSHPGPQLAELYRTAPELAHAAVDFVPVVSRHVETVLYGLLAIRASGRTLSG
jgi:AcrR family transcriptional regulator